MDPRKLEIFLKLLETRSFSKTAAILGLSQPSVSASLKALETELGQKLFERTPRSVQPLETAATLAPFAQSMVETAAQAAWAVNHKLVDAQERLTIGASSVPALAFAPPALAAFCRAYPNVLVKISSSRSQSVARQVAEGEIDLGLVGTLPQEDNLNRVAFSRDRLVLLASPQLAKSIGRPPQSAEDLLDWPLIMREDGSGTRAAFLAALSDKAGPLASGIKIVAEVDDLGPAIALARESVGAAVISSLLPPLINMKNLTHLNLNFLQGRNFYLISRRTASPTPALEALRQLIVAVAKSCPQPDDL